MTVRVGIGLFTGQVPADSSRTFAQEYRETLELVRLAEAAGFDSAWVSEHHGSSDGYLPSLLPMLAAFAASTETILLGTGVVLAPFHDPLRLAEDAAVVDQLSGGRLLLGLGNGWREEEFRMFGVPRSERALRTEETIEILRRAWTGRRFSFEGRVFRYDRVKVTPPPARPEGIPIYLGGYADKAVRRAGRLADGYVADAARDDAARYVALAEESARSAGRDPDSLALVMFRNAFVQHEGDAWETVAGGVAHQIGTYDAWDAGADTPEVDSLTIAPPDRADLRKVTTAGSPEEVRHGLQEILAPFSGRLDLHLLVRLHYPGMDLDTASRALELFAATVMPALKEA
ncbi:MAG: LLM class flavin-dependent oxidoreductase [Actinomycetota bacterium]